MSTPFCASVRGPSCRATRARGAALALSCAGLTVARLLAGCATPLEVAPGTAGRTVIERYGTPTVTLAVPDGTVRRRLVFSSLPLGQRTFMVDLDADDRVLRSWQALTDAHFAQIRIAVDTEETIRREFGPPAIIRTYGPSPLTVWEYPYCEAEVWDSQLSVYVDRGGVVRKTENGPDPWRELRDGRDRGHD